MLAFQRQLNLRNRDVIITNPQNKTNEDLEVIQVNPRSRKGKEIVVNKPIVSKETVVDKLVVKKEHKKEKSPPRELPV